MELIKKASYMPTISVDSSKLVKVAIKLLTILIGDLLCAVAFNGFFIPNHLLSGGVGGMGIMIHYLTELPTGMIILAINLPIFLIGAKIIDKEFTLYSFISMIAMTFLLTITEGIHQFIQLDDILLTAILGGILNGIGMGLMFRNRASQGGMDIIAAIVKKKINLNIGTALLGVNIFIVGSSSILFGIKPAMYTIIGLYISYQIVDKMQIGLDTKKTVIIVSNRPQELANEIIQKLQRGATFLNGEGAYSKDNKKIIYCTIMSSQVGKLKDLVEEVDPNAFITINDTQEVKGRGFKTIGL